MRLSQRFFFQGRRPPKHLRVKPSQTPAIINKKPVLYTDQRVVNPQPKPKPVPVANETKVIKEETKKQEVKKELKSPQSNTERGHYELNALMKRMVEAELRDLMNVIWQELPSTPSNEAESLLVDTLKNEASDDLRNVLGLNVTKRLLNVFNPLNVKVKFNGKPEKEELRMFLKKYNFIAFSRKAVNIFAAQVKSIDDFDRLCEEVEVKCGNVKVTVNPVYQFTTCPPNLKTNYKDVEGIELVSFDKDIEKDVSGKIDDAKSINSKPTNKDVTKLPVKENEPKQDNTVKVVNPKVNENPKPPETVKKTEITDTNKTPAKTIQTNKVENKPQLENKIAQNSTQAASSKVTSQTEMTAAKVITPTKVATTKVVSPPKVIATKVVSPPKVTATKIVSPPKVNATKVISPPKLASTKVVEPPKAATTKVVSSTKVATTKVVSPPKVQTKVTPPTKAVAPKMTPKKINVPTKKASKVEDDFEELDDHDILALMSEGIVLDECTGSDEE